jgi:hypothetical protein
VVIRATDNSVSRNEMTAVSPAFLKNLYKYLLFTFHTEKSLDREKSEKLKGYTVLLRHIVFISRIREMRNVYKMLVGKEPYYLNIIRAANMKHVSIVKGQTKLIETVV